MKLTSLVIYLILPHNKKHRNFYLAVFHSLPRFAGRIAKGSRVYVPETEKKEGGKSD